MEKPNKDQIIMDLQAQVAKQKEEIASIERPTWKTHCSYKRNMESPLNLHTVQDPTQLVSALAHLNTMRDSYLGAAKELGLAKAEFKYDGFTVEDWKHDLSLRLAKINITSKKQKLEAIEKRLAQLESPELKEQRELEAIMKELNGE